MPPSEVLKAQELVYELKIGDIMTRQLVTVTPAATMREVKSTLRDHRISGLPVLADGNLAGVVSIEDVIRALEANDLDAPVNRYMSALVHTIGERESAVHALTVFSQAGVGRLPVVDEEHRLGHPDAGRHYPRRAARWSTPTMRKRRYRARHLFEDIPSDGRA